MFFATHEVIFCAARRGAGRRAADRPSRRAGRAARLPRTAARQVRRRLDGRGEDPDRRRAAARGLGLRRHHRLRGAQPDQRAVRRPGGRGAAGRAVHPANRRAGRLPAGGGGGQARGHRACSSAPRSSRLARARRLRDRERASPSCSPRCRSTGRTWCRASRRRPSRSRSSKRRRRRPGSPRRRGRSSSRSLYGPAEAVTRFQQTCGPVMAKGVEDTALYRWYPAGLPERGGRRARTGSGCRVAEFHAFCTELRPAR